jgi:hypothetical protein
MHSEMSYMRSWPRLIAFHAIAIADEGGETSICRLDDVSSDLAGLLKPFSELGVTYRRRFHKRADVPWQQAFQTDDRAEVERFCASFGIDAQWMPGDGLVTTHKAQGTIAAESSANVYFNQAHIFHPSALDPAIRQMLERAYGKDGLPRSASFGDGSPIGDDDITQIRSAFASRMKRMAWSEGDILLLDNMRFAHGRLPFRGHRKLHVALARACGSPVRTPLFGGPRYRGRFSGKADKS